MMFQAREECRAVIGKKAVTAQGLASLKFTTATIKESLRMYAPASVILKKALKEDVLGEYVIQKGQFVIIPVSVLHDLDTNWLDPCKFIPDRFLDDGTFHITFQVNLGINFTPSHAYQSSSFTFVVLATIQGHTQNILAGGGAKPLLKNFLKISSIGKQILLEFYGGQQPPLSSRCVRPCYYSLRTCSWSCLQLFDYGNKIYFCIW